MDRPQKHGPKSQTGPGFPQPVRTRVRTLAAPCSLGCACGEPVREWVLALADDEQFHAAWLKIVETNPLPSVLGRICYAGCQTACNRGGIDAAVSIRELERFVGDRALVEGWRLPRPAPPSGQRVIVVGSGPCGLSAAYHLARAGHDVVLREAQGLPGGMLRWSISERRLPRDVLDAEIARILALGVTLETRRGTRRVADALAEADGVIWAAGASMCMALVEGRTLWRQPVHTDARVRRTATVSVGRGHRAAQALTAHLAGIEDAADAQLPVADLGRLQTAWYPVVEPALPRPDGRTRSEHARAEAARCLSCGSCFGCARCVAACADGAISAVDGSYQVCAERCTDCGACEPVCPCGAIVGPEPVGASCGLR